MSKIHFTTWKDALLPAPSSLNELREIRNLLPLKVKFGQISKRICDHHIMALDVIACHLIELIGMTGVKLILIFDGLRWYSLVFVGIRSYSLVFVGVHLNLWWIGCLV